MTGDKEKRMNTITTYKKKHINIFEPNQEEIVIEDIAHALSMLTRANGHFKEFFSVAQHSIQCAKEAMARNYTPKVAIACLLHDSSEAYLSDITRPVKKNLPMYQQLENNLQDAIFEKFLPEPLVGEEPSLVKNIDDGCLYYEFLYYMDEKIYSVQPVLISEPDYSQRSMKDVEKEFLELFYMLSKAMEQKDGQRA